MTVCSIIVDVRPYGETAYKQRYEFTNGETMEQFLTLCEVYGIPVVSTTIQEHEGLLG